MTPNDQDTEPTLRTIAEMLQAFRTDVTQRFDALENRVGSLENRMGDVETRLTTLELHVERGFEYIRLQLMHLEVRMDRLEAMGYEALATAKHARANTTVLTEEVRAWGREIQQLRPAA